MPDTLTAFHPAPPQSSTAPAALLTGVQMRDLWTAYEAARDGYSEAEQSSGAAYAEAMNRILQARTVDPEGIAIKVKVLDERADCPKGLLPEVFKDVLQPGGPIPSRLRPLWEAYKATWKTVCDAMDEEDAAMKANPRRTGSRPTAAEKAAKRKRAEADEAFDAARDAVEAAPAVTLDDAICRIEYAIDLADETTDSAQIAALNSALRVLRKAA